MYYIEHLSKLIRFFCISFLRQFLQSYLKLLNVIIGLEHPYQNLIYLNLQLFMFLTFFNRLRLL